MTRVVIVGGSDAGISAALRARELDATAEVTVIVADRFPNYSICGLPFYLSGEVSDWQTLAHRSEHEITNEGIQLLLEQTAQSINPQEQRVTVVDRAGLTQSIPYDRLIIATGAVPKRPHVSGLDLPGVYLLHSMEECFAVEAHLATHASPSVVIIGGGYIGLEMADALTRRGLTVTVVEHAPSVLKTVDASLGELVKRELKQHGVTVENTIEVTQIRQGRDGLCVMGSGDFQVSADLVVVAVGVRPLTDLVPSAGLAMGIQGAIQVTRRMETTIPAIYAAGDCVETWHHLLNQPTYLPLGTTAHKQGRVAGENAVGGNRQFAGTLGTQVVKVFDLVVARTGLRDQEASEAGFKPYTVEATFWDHKVYYPGAKALHIRLTGDRQTGLLLGVQMVGHVHSEVAKRIDTVATLLFHEMNVATISDLDLSYTPPLGSPWDPLQMIAQTWVKAQVKSMEAPIVRD